MLHDAVVSLCYNCIHTCMYITLPPRFHLCFASLLIVGIGSGMFHMTLLYEMQLLDELPMIWGGFILGKILLTA